MTINVKGTKEFLMVILYLDPHFVKLVTELMAHPVYGVSITFKFKETLIIEKL